jgi:integrase
MPKLLEGSAARIQIPAGAKDVLVFDDVLPGFGIRKFASGKASFFVKYTLPSGQQRKITLGAVVPGMLAEMRKEASRILAQVKLGQDPAGEKKKAAEEAEVKRSATVGSLVERYIQERARELRPRTLEEFARHLRKHWAPLHGLGVDGIVRRDIVAAIDTIADEHGRVAADRAKATLSGFFAWALDRHYCEVNPVLGIKRRSGNGSRDRVLAPAELAEVWKACPESDYGRIIKLLVLTGQRRNEIANLLWSEVDLFKGAIDLPASRTKNGNPHLVPLSMQAFQILESTPRISGREFVFGEGASGFQGWSRAKKTLDEKINERRAALGEKAISEWRLHDLRRSFVTNMAENKLALPHIIEACVNHISGHKGGVAGVYNRAQYAEEKREAFGAWSSFIEGWCGK